MGVGAIEAGLVGTFAGIMIGLVIGFYKAKAEDSENYVKKDDCIRCAEARAMLQEKVDDRIDRGTAMFAQINASIAVILTRLDDMKAAAAAVAAR
jgi:hypothetical protein